MMYAKPSQMLARYDSRVVGGYLRDDGIQVSEEDILNDPLLNEALEDASGQIRSAAMVADKYTEADLQTLARDNDSFLVRLTCDLAIAFLVNRRLSTQELPYAAQRAEEYLAMLRFGERIFNVAENKAAGNAGGGYITNTSRTLSQFISDANRFFPARPSRPTRDG